MICILFFLILSSFLFLITPLFSSVPFVPVKKKTLNKIVSALNLDEQSILYDLGCGDGRVLFAAQRAHPQISCVGIEISPFPFLLAKIKQAFSPKKNVHIFYGDFFNLDISKATHIFLYLFPETLDILLPKLKRELKTGSKVISCDFEFSKIKPEKIIEIKSMNQQKNKKLYIYSF